jgi:hypothetical protein
MGYSIHIERDSPIALSDWCAAVQRTAGVRLADGDLEIADPRAGKIIRLPNLGGDAEMFFPAEARWQRVFYWRSGRISFKASFDFVEPGSDIRRLAAELARALGASLVGDEGEIYD